jgi:hypothetical protein
MLARGDEAVSFAADLRFFDIRTGEPLDIGVVNRDSVEGFELLYATPGTGDIAEIAGHLLLRIRRRAPVGQTPPPDLVVSFLAATDPVPQPSSPVSKPDIPRCRGRNWLNLVLAAPRESESPWRSLWQSLKGLTGGFPVVMDVQTLDYTLKTYTVEQDRSLLRYALNLDEPQRNLLLDHLIHLQTAPLPSYYFFHQNCGSVLVQVIGEGLQHAETVAFRPVVSPPHSLVAFLLRHDILQPQAPAFHSFRARGYLYRDLFRTRYASLRQNTPELDWPAVEDFVSGSETRRTEALLKFKAVALSEPALAPDVYALASLLQEMEMVFDPKDRLCRDYTSPVTHEARLLQRELLSDSTQPFPPVNWSEALIESPAARRMAEGSDHTGLFTFQPGFALYKTTGADAEGVASFSGALLKQEMGSCSRVAMQRAGFVELGGYSFLGDADNLREARITGLELRKFRENQGEVEAGFSSLRGWGLGLKVLDFHKREIGPEWQGTLGGLALLCNLFSRSQHRHYAFVGSGVEFGFTKEESEEADWDFSVPLQAESLFSFRYLQWRSRLIWNDAACEWNVSTDLSYPLTSKRNLETLVRVSAQRLQTDDADERWLGMLSVEVNRF